MSLQESTQEIPKDVPKETPKTEGTPHPYTVTELSKVIKARMEGIGMVWLTGEISNLKYHTSGHVYFTLKDSENQINAVIWRHAAKKIELVRDGLEVLVMGEITAYGPQSKYQINVETLELRGHGLLLVALEELKKKLSALGLFDPAHKKHLPYLPKKICIITSPTGAAIQDMLSVLGKRFPKVTILIYPVRVQGEGAAKEIAEALCAVNEKLPDVDVIITGRGGGSLEDLWCFNEEIVAHAIYASKIPVISAVGHEIDVTISDLVADRRAPTPTAAAEMVVPYLMEVEEYLQNKARQIHMAFYNRLHLAKSQRDRLASHRAFTKPMERIRFCQQKLDNLQQRLLSAMEKQIQRRHMLLSQMQGKLMLQQPSLRMHRYREQLDRLAERLPHALTQHLERVKKDLSGLESHLKALSPLKVLARGYSIAYDYSGQKVIVNHEQTQKGDLIWIRMADSWILSQVYKTGKNK